MTTNDKDGYPQITLNTDHLYDAANKVWDLYYDESACRSVESMNPTGDMNMWTYSRRLFTQDKFLFHIGLPLIFDEFRDMESDFGLLPLPKFNSSQTRYYHWLGDLGASMLSVPVTYDLERTGIVLEAMAAESMYTLTPAYNEVLLKRKYVRDAESEFILDIVNETRTYDLSEIFSWNIGSILNDLTAEKSRDIASKLETVKDVIQAAIDKTLSAVE